MNSILEDYYPLFRLYQALREQLMEILSDEDLGFQPAAATERLGSLCLDIGETEYAYIQSFRTFELDFSYRNPNREVASGVSSLSAWFRALDEELEAVIGAISEADVQTRQIDRGGGFKVSPLIQLTIYQEALLIFYGKVSIYLKVMGKQPSEQWRHWIG